MSESQPTRRATLKMLGTYPVLALGLWACGKSEPDSCQDVAGLSEAEKMGRSALQYVDRSLQADKHCRDCNLFQAPPEVSQCGSCQVVKGPIHPQGYCTAWVKKS
jgi:hypothetical protein